MTVDPGGVDQQSKVRGSTVNSEAINDQHLTVDPGGADQQSKVRGSMVNSEAIDDQTLLTVDLGGIDN